MPIRTPGEKWIRLLRAYCPVADNEAMQAVLAEMKRFNIVKGVVSGPLDTALKWGEAAPNVFISGIVPEINTLLPPVSRLRQGPP